MWNYYAPNVEGIINAYDLDLAIEWGINQERVVQSEKDAWVNNFEWYTMNPVF